jgi:hypothetical protein
MRNDTVNHGVLTPVLQTTRHSRSSILINQNCCILRALYNKDKYDGELTIVAGSLGIGIGEPFFEFGGPSYSLSQFLRPPGFLPHGGVDLSLGVDSHVWLEDLDGKVFDVCDAGWLGVARMRGKKLTFCAGEVIEGVTKAELERKGLHYIAADDGIQKELVFALKKRYGFKLFSYGLHEGVLAFD